MKQKQSNLHRYTQTPHKQFAHHQKGFTLVEIMIAVAIGLLMVAGIMQISAASRESGRLQRNLSGVQENIRTSLTMLSRDIRRAGYYEGNNLGDRPMYAPQPIVAATSIDGGGAENDQITVTFESTTDCLGQATPTDARGDNITVNQYFISNQRLMCRGNGNAAAQPLAEGVESMQILYGENTDPDPLTDMDPTNDDDPVSANRYVNPAQANLSNVVSVRIALRFQSREAIRSTADTNRYALLDSDPFSPPDGDRRMRREITTTVSLRN